MVNKEMVLYPKSIIDCNECTPTNLTWPLGLGNFSEYSFDKPPPDTGVDKNSIVKAANIAQEFMSSAWDQTKTLLKRHKKTKKERQEIYLLQEAFRQLDNGLERCFEITFNIGDYLYNNGWILIRLWHHVKLEDKKLQPIELGDFYFKVEPRKYLVLIDEQYKENFEKYKKKEMVTDSKFKKKLTLGLFGKDKGIKKLEELEKAKRKESNEEKYKLEDKKNLYYFEAEKDNIDKVIEIYPNINITGDVNQKLFYFSKGEKEKREKKKKEKREKKKKEKREKEEREKEEREKEEKSHEDDEECYSIAEYIISKELDKKGAYYEMLNNEIRPHIELDRYLCLSGYNTDFMIKRVPKNRKKITMDSITFKPIMQFDRRYTAPTGEVWLQISCNQAKYKAGKLLGEIDKKTSLRDDEIVFNKNDRRWVKENSDKGTWKPVPFIPTEKQKIILAKKYSNAINKINFGGNHSVDVKFIENNYK